MTLRKEEVIGLIRTAFSAAPYPGDAFLQGSFDGCEPYDEVSAFVGKSDWTELDPEMLDARYSALSFFSEAGFRLFLPAYLIADLNQKLLTADPLFHLCHGFASVSTEMPVGSETFRRESGGKSLLNPKRYGAMTWSDHARCRLSVFTREESQAIIAYMTYKREQATTDLERSRIDAALREFWSDRAKNAPAREALESHLQGEQRFAAAIQRKNTENQSQ